MRPISDPSRPDTAFATLPGPWGPIHVAARDGRIVALELLTPTEAFVAGLARRLHTRVVRAVDAGSADRRVLSAAADEVAAYLAGDEAGLDLPIDLDDLAGWDTAVLAAVRRVPFGAVTSYGRLARQIGRPGAARAVGGAVGRNPIGLLVPCHRVIAGDGSLGGYGGDRFGSREQLLAVKRWLLEREGTHLPATEFFEATTA
jgi:methylated-DNA-[protein]-cysteine S-methyltransferase